MLDPKYYDPLRRWVRDASSEEEREAEGRDSGASGEG